MSKTTIPTGGIADDAIGNTKLALDANYAFTGTITGTPSGMTLLATSVVSGTGTTNVQLNNHFNDTLYNAYTIYINNCTPLTNAKILYIRFVAPNGDIITASDYVHVTNVASRNISSDASEGAYNAGEGTFGRVNGNVDSSSDDTYATNYIMHLVDPLNTTSYKSIQWQSTGIDQAATGYRTNNGSVWLKQTAALGGIQFYFSEGNIAVPTEFRLYGVTK